MFCMACIAKVYTIESVLEKNYSLQILRFWSTRSLRIPTGLSPELCTRPWTAPRIAA